METNCFLLLANLLLYSSETEFIQKFLSETKKNILLWLLIRRLDIFTMFYLSAMIIFINVSIPYTLEIKDTQIRPRLLHT